MALTCRAVGCPNALKPHQMSFCSLNCLREFSARSQYPGRERWSKYHKEWMERLSNLGEPIESEDLTDYL